MRGDGAVIRAFVETLEGDGRDLFFLCSDPAGERLEAVSARQLWQMCRRWAAAYRQRPEAVVAVFGHMTPAMIAAWLAAAWVGRLPVFIAFPSRKVGPADYARRLDNYRQRFGPCLFVGEESERGLCPDLLTAAALTDDSWRPEAGTGGGTGDVDAPLFVQCGSGTTGLQKAVAITAGQLAAQIDHYRRILALDPARDRIVNWLPLYHDMGLVTAFLLPLLTRTPVLFIDTFEWAANPQWLLRVLERQRGTLCWLPNFAFALLARGEGEYNLGSVRAFINCSEPVSAGAFARFAARHGVDGSRLGVCYALAENVFAVSQTALGTAPEALLLERTALQRRQVVIRGRLRAGEPPPEGAAEAVVFSCGPVIPGMAVRIRARPGEQVGEVDLGGVCAVRGYHNQPPEARDGWLATGDLGFIHDGALYLTGRVKDLIIHNGRNLYPQDLEEVVNGHPEVYPGRVAVAGLWEEGLDSERILVLFEPRETLSLARREQAAGAIRELLDLRFDVPTEVHAVPRMWLRKTSSGKISRRANLEKFLAAHRNTLYLCGDSHVRLFWTAPTAHRNLFERLRATWLGLLWSDNWRQTLPFFLDLAGRAGAGDILVIQAGEPECRTLFPAAADPLARIERSVAGYREFFLTLRRIWPGRLAYMTGIPTHPQNIDNGDAAWPIRGTPEERYRFQEIFYRRMAVTCTELVIHFVDACTPFLEADGFMDPARLADRAHLDPRYRERILVLFEERFGYLNTAPNRSVLADPVWDGRFEHYLELAKERIREMALMSGEPDWAHLVSSGVLDSLAIVELVAMLERVFGFRIDPAAIRRDDFESLTGLYEPKSGS